jgi:hypothetical protein
VTAPANLARNLVIVACAASAGVHAGLVLAHLGEDPKLGVAFALAAVLLLAVTVALVRTNLPRRPAALAGGLLAALIVAYAASRTVGLPLAREHTEPLDALGLVTQAVDAMGLIAALRLCEPAAGAALGLALRKDTG